MTTAAFDKMARGDQWGRARMRCAARAWHFALSLAYELDVRDLMDLFEPRFRSRPPVEDRWIQLEGGLWCRAVKTLQKGWWHPPLQGEPDARALGPVRLTIAFAGDDWKRDVVAVCDNWKVASCRDGPRAGGEWFGFVLFAEDRLRTAASRRCYSQWPVIVPASGIAQGEAPIVGGEFAHGWWENQEASST